MEQHGAWRLWIIEYAWAHNMIDVFQDVKALYWPDGDWEIGLLSLDESWHVRVVSAQVYTIVKNRKIYHYERVLAFLEHIHTLLPTLVPAIKHMKIVFGLKTMRKHEMYLMRRNQLDFRTFAQSLVMDKQRLEDYIQNHMEEQYGENYAQKTEERLLYYLRELDKALPQWTYIDKIMKKNSPVKEDEKALLDLISDDLRTTASTLKTLLHSDAACCYSPSKLHLGTRTIGCTFMESCVCAGTSKKQLKSAAEKSLELDCPVTDTRVHIDGPRTEHALGLQNDKTNKTTSATQTDNMGESCLKHSSIKGLPQYCSKHQRWVSNILCECPGESSEEQPHQDGEISPPLFTSTSFSSDLTPSDLPILAKQHLSLSTPSQLQEAEENPKTVEKLVSEPVDLAPPPLPSALPAVESFIPGGSILKVVVVPCMAITRATVCPVKSSATPKNMHVCNYEDSTASSTVNNSAETSMPQTATSSQPFISKRSRQFRLGKKFSQSQKVEGNGAKKVHYSSQMNFVNAQSDASLSTHSTSGMGISCNIQKCIQAQSSSVHHMASSQDNLIFDNDNMKPCVVLKRMSIEECLRVTKGRFQCGQCGDKGEHIDPEFYVFDVNSLYSSSSSEETDSDTEYRPTTKTLKRWSRGLLPI
ncbi:hypothetical protein NQD34_004479 [Periophthalmus magnuspinnatus]|nr:hypothetical protein NQD34_004479 [Periophthalmus magnuspinnatus]